ncbi:MAG: hypothetical protein LBM08_00690 [Dysgonamonadaceae bacterium]|jgi:hypothetical protein|nr:hypothetical protein [Dysgonamonadaceae bacterium]
MKNLSIVLLVLCSVGAVIYMQNEHDKIKECTEANDKFIASTATLNGLSMSDHASMTDKYLRLVYDKQLDVNTAIGEHVRLIKERLAKEEAQKVSLKE